MAEDKARHMVSDIKSEEGTSPVAVTAKLKSEGLCETIPENPQMDSSGLDMKKIYAFGDSNTYGFDQEWVVLGDILRMSDGPV